MNLNDFRLNAHYEHPDDKVLFVGTALDGPTEVAFTLADHTDPIEFFGDSPLAEAAIATLRAGNVNAVFYRLNGIHSEAVLKNEAGESLIEFRSITASEKYNDIQMTLFSDHLYVVGTEGSRRSYFFDRYPTVSSLVYAINQDAFYGLVEFQATLVGNDEDLMGLMTEPTEILFQGGSSEEHLVSNRDPESEGLGDSGEIWSTLKGRLLEALFGEDPDDQQEREANGLLGSELFSVIALAGIFHEDDPEIASILEGFSKSKSETGDFGCVAVIGNQPLYLEHAEYHLDITPEESLENKKQELLGISSASQDMNYTQIIVGHTHYPEFEKREVSKSYAFASAQAASIFGSSMTNKKIGGFSSTSYQFTKEDIALLTSNGYTCIVPSIRRGFVPYQSVSYSRTHGGMMKPHNVRLAQWVSRALTEYFDGMVGDAQTSLSIKRALEGAEEFLDYLVEVDVIRSYSFEHALSDWNRLLTLNVSLGVHSEVESIQSIASIVFPEGVVEE